MANRQRGEVTMVLNGRKLVLRPTFDAMCQLEDYLGTTIVKVLGELEQGVARVKTISAIIWAGWLGYNEKSCPTVEEVGDMVLKDGLLKVLEQKTPRNMNPVYEFIYNGILGGEDPKAEDLEEADDVSAGKPPKEIASA